MLHLSQPAELELATARMAIPVDRHATNCMICTSWIQVQIEDSESRICGQLDDVGLLVPGDQAPHQHLCSIG